MKRLLFAPLILILLTSCQSKKDICALRAANQISREEAAKKLGINTDDTEYSYQVGNRITNFCKFYTN